jgi:hypothetical protein
LFKDVSSVIVEKYNEDTLTLDLIMAIISSFSSLNLSIKPTSEAPQVASPVNLKRE